MGQTINNAYIAALVNGLASPDWLSLDSEEQSLLNRAKALMGRGESPQSPKPLTAITGRVWQGSTLRYFKPARLSLDTESETIFASDANGSIEIPHAYTKEVETELDELWRLYPQDCRAFRYSLFHSMYAWGSRVAFDAPDVSAFDNNRLLAAAVPCLRADAEQFLLLKGAVAGIQSFIYHDIGGEQIGDAQDAAKRLRGRSFLVAHLCQVVAEYLSEELELEQANILFVGGGHFNMLLPDTPAIREKLEGVHRALNLGLFRNVGMQLSVLLAWESGPARDLYTNTAYYFHRVTDKLESAKNQKHVRYLDEFFRTKKQVKEYTEDAALGSLVPYADFMMEVKINPQGLDKLNTLLGKNQRADIQVLGFIDRQYFLFKKNQVQDFLQQYGAVIREHSGHVKIWKFNDTDFIPTQLPEPEAHLGFLFLGKAAPKGFDRKKDRSVMMFEDLATLDTAKKPELSYPQLAAMRLDVDDLGTLFAYGLGRDVSIDRLSSLSREFQLFFGGYFNRLADKYSLYVTYSGGDDAFVIGSWLNIVHFAGDLHKDFTRFTCGNPHITLSAGVFTCSPFYPVVRFAADALRLLDDRAKKFGTQNGEVGKNAICLFDHTLGWKRFLDMLEFSAKLESVVPKEGKTISETDGRHIRRSMLQHLLKTIQLGRIPQEILGKAAKKRSENDLQVLQQRSFEFYRNIGRLHGLFARHGYGAGSIKEKKDQASELVRQLLEDSGSPERFADFILAIQYVLYKTRVINKK